MAGRPDSFMPFYIGDYLADTSHLSAAEHGAYILLLFHYWRTGLALIDDDCALKRIARMSQTEWKASKATLRAFFKPILMDGDMVLTNSRVEKELARAGAKYASRKAASEAANAALQAKRDAYRDGDRDGNVKDAVKVTLTVLQPQPQPQSSSTEEEKNKKEETTRPSARKAAAKKRTPLPDHCPSEKGLGDAVHFWGVHARFDLADGLNEQVDQFCDHHLKTGSLMADWDAAWRTWYRNALKFNGKPKGESNGRRESAHMATARITAELLAELEPGNGSGNPLSHQRSGPAILDAGADGRPAEKPIAGNLRRLNGQN